MTRRPWTAQDQAIAEVAVACGVSLKEIGRSLGRSPTSVSYNLDPAAAQKHRESACRLAKANPEKQREKALRWRKANPAKFRECVRRYRNANPDKTREMKRRRKAIKRAAGRCALVPLTAEQRRKRFSLFRNRCAFCGVNAKHHRNHDLKQLTEEHVLPLSNGGLDEASNVLPACKNCNSGKRDAPLEQWYRAQPFFTEKRWLRIKRHCPGAHAGQLPLAMLPGDTEAA